MNTAPDSLALEPLVLDPLPPLPRLCIAVINSSHGSRLAECLDSCLAQSVLADEIVLVDDASSDQSAEVIAFYAGEFPEIRVARQAHRSPSAATNLAFRMSTSDVVLLVEAKDSLHTHRLRLAIEALREPVDGALPGWVHHPVERVTPDGSPRGVSPHYEGDAPSGWLGPAALEAASSPVRAPASALAFRRELLLAIGPLDEDPSMHPGLQLRTAACLLSPVAFVPQPLTRHRLQTAPGGIPDMASHEQVQSTRREAQRVDDWLRELLNRRCPGTSILWRPLEDQANYLWLAFVERWLAGESKDRQLLDKVLQHPDSLRAPRLQRLYTLGGRWLPRPLFLALSRLIFGSGLAKRCLRRLMGRA